MGNRAKWLDADQQRVWRNWLLAVARINQYLDNDLRASGLDLNEYEILVCLSEADDRRMRMSELADKVHQSRSRLTHSISRLERQGIVERCSAEDDRRGVYARLTDKGFELLDQAAPGHVSAVRRIFVDAADEADFQALGRVMEAVLAVED